MSNIDVEVGMEQPADAGAHAMVITDLESYPGNNREEKIDSAIDLHSVLIISKSTCPFCRDVKDLLMNKIGVTIHTLEVNEHPDGGKIFAYGKHKTGKSTVPQVFIRGKYIGGCDDVKALHHKGKLEPLLKGLINKSRLVGTDRLETAHMVPVERGIAMNPLFWFPNVVNNHVIRVVGFQVCALSVVCTYYYDELWAHWLTVFVLLDFCLRFMAGAAASPLGMIATFLTSPWRPLFRPGPPKQFAASCGIMFSGLGTLFYFLNFEHSNYVGMAFMAGLAGASGLEWMFDFCLGCKFFSIGIYLGLIPDYAYRIYTSSRQETEDSWNYMFLDSKAIPPEKVDRDPTSKISLKYKKKTDEWSKDDFDFIRHMQIGYFAMPLSLCGLAVTFKIASDWTDDISKVLGVKQRELIVHEGAFQAIAAVAFFIFFIFCGLFALRLIMYPHKCLGIDWQCPLRGPSFSAIPLCLMLFAFLAFDQIEYDEDAAMTGDEANPQIVARVFFWIGAIAQSIIAVMRFGEWLGRRMELEHVHPQWIMAPVGLSVAAMITPVVPMFAADNDQAEGMIFVARFFQSFALFMFLALFTITFFKVVTSHNSDTGIRHGVFVWLAATSILGMAEFTICFFSPANPDKHQCVESFSSWFFVSLFIFLGILYSAMPSIGFIGKDKWGMEYWTGCFAITVLAGAGCLFYAVTGFRAAQNISIVGLCLASIANFVNLLHTGVALIRRREVFTPVNRWGPLSFMKLTHEAFRGNMSTMRESLENLDLSGGDETAEMLENLSLFAVHLNRFSILHEEHSKHEDEVIFKVFNDWFHDHAKQFNDDHDDFHSVMADVEKNANMLLDRSLPLSQRQEALALLKKFLPPFFESFEEHLKGEEDNLQPIGKKYLPLQIQKDISRKVWEITSADRWEIIIPYVVLNLPRHLQRVRYLKVLMWSMPERAQQIGAIVYRNVDAVMWERLKEEVPEMIPRGESGWWRYY